MKKACIILFSASIIRYIYLILYSGTGFVLEFALNLFFCGVYIYIFFKEGNFLSRNKENNPIEIGNKCVVLSVLCVMAAGILVEVVFNLPMIYIALAVVNGTFIGVLMHNDIIVSDKEILYRNMVIHRDEIEMVRIVEEKRHYVLLELQYSNNTQRIPVKRDFLEYFV